MNREEKPNYGKLEEQLRKLTEEKNFYKTIADNTYDWESYRTPDGKLIYVNNAFERITGYSAKEHLAGNIPLTAFVHPDDWQKLNTSYQLLQKGSEVQINKIRVIRPDKSIRHVSVYSYPVFSDGQLLGIRSSSRDITNEEDFKESKSLNKKLRSAVKELKSSKRKEEKSHRQFKDLFLSMTEGVYFHELIFNEQKEAINYRVIEANPSSENHLGIKPDKAIGKLATELYGVPEAPYLKIYANAALKSENVKFEDFFEPLKRWFSISVFGLGKNKFASIFTDITEKVEWETSLKKAKDLAEDSEMKLHTLINAIPDLVWLKDDKGVFLGCNSRFEDLYGTSEKEIIGKTDDDFVGKEIAEYYRKYDKIALEAGKPSKNEEPALFKSDGHEEYLETIKTPMYSSNGQLVGVLGIGRNITERKIAESELVKAKEMAEKADRAKSLFLSNMSHEIRTPMNGIMGFADLLDNEKLSAKQRENYTKIIKNSGRQLLNIIDDILEISRLETKRVKAVFEYFNLNELLAELYSIFKIDEKNNKIPLYLKTPLANDDSVIYSDRSKLIKILSNLIENSFRYTEIGFIEIGYSKENENLVIYVKDTGIGIEKEKQDKVFERFTQAEEELSRRSGGLGLGLSIVKENAELIGAEIRLESEARVGSTFFITIPYNTNREIRDIKLKYPEIQTSGIKKSSILVAEDEEINYMYVETLLNDMGEDFQIFHARNGLEALEIIKQNPAIDLVLMDIKMPEMNGYTATEMIKKIKPGVPVIAQTAYAAPEEKEQALSAGCDDIITKPIAKEFFKEKIRLFLQSQ